MILDTKTVLITGASKGIGRATAIAFAKQGCSVIINYKSEPEIAEEVLKECNSYSEGNIIVLADISNEKDIQGMFKEIKKKFSHIDILVNNAGVFDEHDSYDNVAAFEHLFKINFLGAVTVTKYTLEMMKKGKIINVSSINARLGHGRPKAIAYSAFKAALENYSDNLAKELAPDVLVNCIAPGRVATPMWGNPDEKEQKELGKVHLIKRMIQPDEIADGILFLAKNDAMCGEVLTIDGGMGLGTLAG